MKMEPLKLAKFEALENSSLSYVVGGTSTLTKGSQTVSSSNDLSTDGGPGVHVPGGDWAPTVTVPPPPPDGIG